MRGVLLDPKTGRPLDERALDTALELRGLRNVADLIALGRERPHLQAAEVTPPLYMDVSSAYSGDELGLPYRDLATEGILGVGDLAVSAGAGNSVNIAAGSAWVLGDTNVTRQPNYRVLNDAVVNKGITPDPSNPRRVLVVAQIVDESFAGTGRLWRLDAIHGTPAGVPVVPALPASALPLANVLVPAAAASSAAYTITNLRQPAKLAMRDLTVVYSSIDIAITNNTMTRIDWNSEQVDDRGRHDPAVNPSRITFDYDGLALIGWQTVWQNVGVGDRWAEVRLNGGAQFIRGSVPRDAMFGNGPMAMSAPVPIAAGDYAELFVQHNAGAAANLLGNNTLSRLWALRL